MTPSGTTARYQTGLFVEQHGAVIHSGAKKLTFTHEALEVVQGGLKGALLRLEDVDSHEMARVACSHYLVMINGRFVIVHESAQVISALCLSSLASSLVWIVFVTRGDPPSSTRLAHTSPQPPRARTPRARTPRVMTTTKTRASRHHLRRVVSAARLLHLVEREHRALGI